jgi:hypothetical protein
MLNICQIHHQNEDVQKVNAKESINENKVGQKWNKPQAYKYTDDDANVPKQCIHNLHIMCTTDCSNYGGTSFCQLHTTFYPTFCCQG